MSKKITCKSCREYRMKCCAVERHAFYPSAENDGKRCDRMCYEPGADEEEDSEFDEVNS